MTAALGDILVAFAAFIVAIADGAWTSCARPAPVRRRSSPRSGYS